MFNSRLFSLGLCALGLFGLVTISGCSSHNVQQSVPPKPVDIEQEYLIGVGDTLTVNVWKSPELSIAVPVRPDGKISIPLSGDVIAAGTSAESLAKKITQSYSQFVRNPQVTVIITNPNSAQYLRRVRITGAVNGQLSVPYSQGMTVLDLVLAAGGVNAFARANDTRLYRKVDGELKVFSVKLNDILQKGKLATNYELAPSDILTVPERVF